MFNDEGMVATIHSSKTDQLRDVANLVIALTGTVSCMPCWHDAGVLQYG